MVQSVWADFALESCCLVQPRFLASFHPWSSRVKPGQSQANRPYSGFFPFTFQATSSPSFHKLNAHDSSPVWYRTKCSKIMNSQPRQIELTNRQIMVMLSVDVHFAFLDVLCSMNGSILKKQWRVEQRPLEPQHWSNEGTPQQIEIRDNKHINWTP